MSALPILLTELDTEESADPAFASRTTVLFIRTPGLNKIIEAYRQCFSVLSDMNVRGFDSEAEMTIFLAKNSLSRVDVCLLVMNLGDDDSDEPTVDLDTQGYPTCRINSDGDNDYYQASCLCRTIKAINVAVSEAQASRRRRERVSPHSESFGNSLGCADY